MALKFSFKANIEQWRQMVLEKQRPVVTAAVAALRDVAATTVQEGRQDIGAAGPGFRRAEWQSGLRYRTKGATEGAEGGLSLDATATISHRYGIAGMFEYGPTTIQGHPLMWIPTAHKGATASRFGGSILDKTRSKFLESATINGTPVMFDKREKKNRDRKPVFIGIRKATIPDKFHITEIAEKQFDKFAAFFFLHFEDNS